LTDTKIILLRIKKN